MSGARRPLALGPISSFGPRLWKRRLCRGPGELYSTESLENTEKGRDNEYRNCGGGKHTANDRSAHNLS